MDTVKIKQMSKPNQMNCSRCGRLYNQCRCRCSPGGVPTADASVKAYQEDIKAGVDVSGDEFGELKASELFY
jgi:hypothetical protein